MLFLRKGQRTSLSLRETHHEKKKTAATQIKDAIQNNPDTETIPVLLVRTRVRFEEQGVIVFWDHLLQDKHYFNINILRHINKVGRYIHTLMQM